MKKQISETEDKVKTKRKHLEDLREELKELGKSFNDTNSGVHHSYLLTSVRMLWVVSRLARLQTSMVQQLA